MTNADKIFGKLRNIHPTLTRIRINSGEAELIFKDGHSMITGEFHGETCQLMKEWLEEKKPRK